MPVKYGTPAYIRKQEKLKTKRKEQRAAARLARHTDGAPPSVPPDPEHYRLDPIGWARDALGVDPRTFRWSAYGGAYDTHVWDGDVDPLAKILEALARGEWVGVESGTGTGKTFLAAVIMLWFLENFKGSKVVTTAPREKQLHEHMWQETGKFWPRFAKRRPQAELKQLKLRMEPPGESWSAVGFGVGVGADEESATKAQGFHEAYQLIIVEETPGVKPAVMTAFEQTSTRPRTNLILALGNPDNQLDPLHLFCTSAGVTHIRISAYDHPNVVLENDDVVPGAVTRASIDRREKKLGTASPLFQSRIRGISPAEAADALIKLTWIREAAARVLPDGPPALGVDVANSVAGDLAALASGRGAMLMEVDAFPCPDANRMARERVAPRIAAGLPAAAVGVDGIGVGAGAVNELLRLGHRVTNIQSGGAPVPRPGDVEQYLNLRAQMWWLLGQDLQHGHIGGPAFTDPELQTDLTRVRVGTRNGKIFVQAKEDLRKLLGRSPNKADAVAYWNWVRRGGAGRRVSGLVSQGQW
jgi:hypothetical protein